MLSVYREGGEPNGDREAEISSGAELRTEVWYTGVGYRWSLRLGCL